jgi:hypothetical protein
MRAEYSRTQNNKRPAASQCICDLAVDIRNAERVYFCEDAEILNYANLIHGEGWFQEMTENEIYLEKIAVLSLLKSLRTILTNEGNQINIWATLKFKSTKLFVSKVPNINVG